MWFVIGGIVLLVVMYGVINGSRNSDPLNRKCAAEICEYLTSTEDFDPVEIQAIFQEHARYQKQANHVASMVPALLINAGIPKDAAMQIYPLVKSAAAMQPR
ncbi:MULTISPECIES: hypothetical protein [Marinobacter]|nr:hypothetical protein [Marinobacter excellens]